MLALGAGPAARTAVQHAPIPILVARTCPTGTRVTDSILVPVDASAESRCAVELAGRLAAADGATVTILAAPPRDARSSGQSPRADASFSTRPARCRASSASSFHASEACIHGGHAQRVAGRARYRPHQDRAVDNGGHHRFRRMLRPRSALPTDRCKRPGCGGAGIPTAAPDAGPSLLVRPPATDDDRRPWRLPPLERARGRGCDNAGTPERRLRQRTIVSAPARARRGRAGAPTTVTEIRSRLIPKSVR